MYKKSRQYPIRFVQDKESSQAKASIDLAQHPLNIYMNRLTSQDWKDKGGSPLLIISDGGRLSLPADADMIRFLLTCSDRLGYSAFAIEPKSKVQAQYHLTLPNHEQDTNVLLSPAIGTDNFTRTLHQFIAIACTLQ